MGLHFRIPHRYSKLLFFQIHAVGAGNCAVSHCIPALQRWSDRRGQRGRCAAFQRRNQQTEKDCTGAGYAVPRTVKLINFAEDRRKKVAYEAIGE